MIDDLKQCYIVLYRVLSGFAVSFIPFPFMLINMWFALLFIIFLPLGAVIMDRQCQKLIEK